MTFWGLIWALVKLVAFIYIGLPILAVLILLIIGLFI